MGRYGIMISGKLVSLHAVEKEDLEQLKDWRNNTKLRKNFREYREINMSHQQTWFDKNIVNSLNTLMFSIRRIKDNILLGSCGFVYVNWVHRHADLSLYIGWQDAYIDKEGFAEEGCELLLNYGFNELGLNKVRTEVYEFDVQKASLLEKIGFVQDGKLREHYWYGGRWWDAKLFSILSSEYYSKQRIDVEHDGL